MNVPMLRFNAFSGDWKSKKISQILESVSEAVDVEDDNLYKQIGIRSHGKGIFHKELVTGKALGNKRVFWIKENVFIVNIVFAWEQAVAKTTKNEVGMIASHRFPMYQPLNNLCSVDYILFFFLTKKGKTLLELASPGGAGRNKTLGQSEFKKLKLIIPSLQEQTKIANFLTVVDQKIAQLKHKADLLARYKKGVMQQIFSQHLRFKDDDGRVFPDWEGKALGDISVKKSSNIAANKIEENEGNYKIYGASGVLKKVDFFTENEPYISIVKDGAGVGRTFLCEKETSVLGTMDIIKAKENINLFYLHSVMQQIDFTTYVTGSTIPHIYFKHYLNEKIMLPTFAEQTKIANFLTAIDDKITYNQSQLNALKQYKQGLLQQMFV